MRGGSGHDVVHGGQGDDDLRGGTGNDLLSVCEYDRGDVNVLDGGPGRDVAWLAQTKAVSFKLKNIEIVKHYSKARC